jgi:hypothetical protein
MDPQLVLRLIDRLAARRRERAAVQRRLRRYCSPDQVVGPGR